MAITKIHAIKVRLGDAINYIENPDKTDGQEFLLISIIAGAFCQRRQNAPAVTVAMLTHD